MRDAWIIARHDLGILLRQKETILWTFLMPALFFYFIGTVTQGFNASPRKQTIALSVPSDAGFLADELALRLEDEGLAVERYADGVAPGAELPFPERKRRLAVPPAFTERVLAGEAQVLEHGLTDDDALDHSFDGLRVKRAAYTVLADLAVATSAAEGAAPTAADVAAVRTMPRALTLDVGHPSRTVPTGFQQSVPGTMVMFVMVVLLTSGATTLLAERKEGLLRRLASAPIGRGSVVAGKWLSKLLLGSIQIAFAMALGSLAFGVEWGPRLPMLCLVLLAYAAFLSSLAILLGNFARSEGQAVGLGVLSANLFGALGGCWWPIEITPPSMQTLALFLPTGWAMDALHKLMVFELASSDALPHVVGMAFGTLVLGWVAARTFRFG